MVRSFLKIIYCIYHCIIKLVLEIHITKIIWCSSYFSLCKRIILNNEEIAPTWLKMPSSSCAKQVILPFIVVINSTALFNDKELNELNTGNYVVLIHFYHHISGCQYGWGLGLWRRKQWYTRQEEAEAGLRKW